jgi:hypothetical protein
VEEALESLITLSGGETHQSLTMDDERTTLSGIASSLFTYPSRFEDVQNDLSAPRRYTAPRDDDFEVSDEDDHYDDFDLGMSRDEMMLDQISDSIGVSDEHRLVPPIVNFENSLEEIDDTPLLSSANQHTHPVPGNDAQVTPDLTTTPLLSSANQHTHPVPGNDAQVTPDLTTANNTNLPDLTNLYPSCIDIVEPQASSVTDSSDKPSESPKGFAKSIQLADTYEKLAQSSNYYLYDFEEISSANSNMHETESNPVNSESTSDLSPVLDLYESGPFHEVQGPLLADLEKKLGNKIPKPLELGTNVECAQSLRNVGSPLPDDSPGSNLPEPGLELVEIDTHTAATGGRGHSDDSESVTINPVSSNEDPNPIPVVTIGPNLEIDAFHSNNFDNSDINRDDGDHFLDTDFPLNSDNAGYSREVNVGVQESLKGPDVVSFAGRDGLQVEPKLAENSESDTLDVGDDYEDILAAAAAAAEAISGDDYGREMDEVDEGETGRKIVHAYAYSSTGSSKEESPEPLGTTSKKICRKKKKRSDGLVQVVYSGSEEDMSRDADGLVSRMAGARDFLNGLNSEPSAGGDSCEVDLEDNSDRTVEVESLCQRMLGFRNVLKNQNVSEQNETSDCKVGVCDQSDSDMLKMLDIDEMSDMKTLSQSDSESSDSSRRRTWPDILDFSDPSPRPIATISADIADRIPELEIIEYNLETIQESAELSDGGDDSHEKGSIRRFITLDKIELPPNIQRTADLVAKEDHLQGDDLLKFESGASGDDKSQSDNTCVQNVVVPEGDFGSSVIDIILGEKLDSVGQVGGDITAGLSDVLTDAVPGDEVVTDRNPLSQTLVNVPKQEDTKIESEEMIKSVGEGSDMSDEVASAQSVEETIKLLLGIDPWDWQVSGSSGHASLSPDRREATEELPAAVSPKILVPSNEGTDPGARIRMLLGIDTVSDHLGSSHHKSPSPDRREAGEQIPAAVSPMFVPSDEETDPGAQIRMLFGIDTVSDQLGSIGHGDSQVSGSGGHKSLSPDCREATEEISAAVSPMFVPSDEDTDPGAQIRMLFGIDTVSDQLNSSHASDKSDPGCNKQIDSNSSTENLGADHADAIKKLLGMASGLVESETIGSGNEVHHEENQRHDESQVDTTEGEKKEISVVKSESRLSADAQEFIPAAPRENLTTIPPPGVFPPSSQYPTSGPTFMIPTYVTPKMNPELPFLYPPVSYPFYPVPSIPSHQPPFASAGFQSGVYYHSGENLIPQPIGRGSGRGKRCGRKSPFSKLAANFNQVNYTELPMSVPPGFSYGARMSEPPPDLSRYERQRSQPLDIECLENDQSKCEDLELGQFERMGQENSLNSRISRDTQTEINAKQKNHDSKVVSKNDRMDNLNETNNDVSEELILPETCSESEHRQHLSFAAMASKSPRDSTSNRRPQENHTRKTQQSPQKGNPLKIMKRHLTEGHKVLIMMRGCSGSGKSTLAR